jgi:SAM-dependent methyltransferase
MSSQVAFAGSVPSHYDRYLGPTLFEPYAIDLVGRLPVRPGMSVLEVAAGSGRVTRHLLARIPRDATLVATDLNPDMLEVARSQMADPRLEWRPANAQDLPFPDAAFDAVVCQFGAMFYPDPAQGHREAHRVLRPGGAYLLNVWGSQAENPWAAAVQRVMDAGFPGDPPQFMKKPFSMGDRSAVVSALTVTGFESVEAEWVDRNGASASAGALAMGAVQGSPLAGEVAQRGADLDEWVDRVREEFLKTFGEGEIETPLRALVVSARRAG